MLKIMTSTVHDGSMKTKDPSDVIRVQHDRRTFLAKLDSTLENSVLVHLVYEGDDYCRYRTVDESLAGDGMVRSPSFVADGLVTTTPGLTLFLPLADCIGVVLHDQTTDVLMLTHLGRHNLEQAGGTKSVKYMVKQFGCNPKNITAWLSPAAGQENYPLFDFDNRSMHDVATEQLLSAGVLSDNITNSPIDVTKDDNYYSHSEFLKGRRKTDGRFAVVALMR